MLLCLVFLWLWGSTVTASWAATSAIEDLPVAIEQSVLSPSSLDADDISAEKISQFVRVYLQVLGLIEQREDDLQGAETESESVQVRQEVETEALQLIQASGLTLQEYLQLLGLANIDPEFSERVAAQLQEAID